MPSRRINFPFAFFFCCAAIFFQGCAVIPSGRQSIPVCKENICPPYHDYSGVIHVHTYYSESGTSTGSLEEVIAAAKRNLLDFAIIMDHDNIRWLREGKEGLHDNVLIIIGSELSSSAGHMAAMWVDTEIPQTEPRKMLQRIRKQSGLSFICHAEFKPIPWTDWSLTPLMTGMEIFNLSEAARENGSAWMLKAIFYPRGYFYKSLLNRPDNLLKDWDRVLSERKFVGIGSVDAHEKFRFFGIPLDSYDDFFKLVQTHVLAEELSTKTFIASLRNGHAYVGFDIVKPVRDFLFSAVLKNKRVIMGDAIPFAKGLTLKVDLPSEAHIHILKNGALWHDNDGAHLEIAADGPGVYRVEVYLDEKPWVFSNPIYVTK